MLRSRRLKTATSDVAVLSTASTATSDVKWVDIHVKARASGALTGAVKVDNE